MLFSLAWRNLWRQKTRTYLSMASMGFASALLVFMLSMQVGTYETMKTNTLKIFDGFAQVQQPGYSDDPELSNFIENSAGLTEKFSAVDGITAVSRRATGFVILANGETSYGAAVVGVDPEHEPKVSTLSSTVTTGRYLQADDAGTVVLGATLARNLGLEIGDHVTLLGSGADRSIAADSLQLVGVFETGMPQLDRQIAQMPLARFQDTFAMPGGAHNIALTGKTLNIVNRALDDVRLIAAQDGLVVRDWAELQPAIKQAIVLDASTSGAIYISLVIVVVFIILNTLFMSVLERTREFGVLLALGMKPGQIGRMMWIELVMLAVLGCAVGIIVGGAVSYYFQVYGLAIPNMEDMEDMMAQFGLPSRIHPAVTLFSALAGPLAIVAGVAIGGIVPYRRIKGLEPVSAMGSA